MLHCKVAVDAALQGGSRCCTGIAIGCSWSKRKAKTQQLHWMSVAETHTTGEGDIVITMEMMLMMTMMLAMLTTILVMSVMTMMLIAALNDCCRDINVRRRWHRQFLSSRPCGRSEGGSCQSGKVSMTKCVSARAWGCSKGAMTGIEGAQTMAWLEAWARAKARAMDKKLNALYALLNYKKWVDKSSFQSMINSA